VPSGQLACGPAQRQSSLRLGSATDKITYSLSRVSGELLGRATNHGASRFADFRYPSPLPQRCGRFRVIRACGKLGPTGSGVSSCATAPTRPTTGSPARIVGEMQRARDLMERLLRVASPLGLYAEEYDFETGRHLGNFPQAFSHLARYRGRGADHRRSTHDQSDR
jgi:hypothetical protein